MEIPWFVPPSDFLGRLPPGSVAALTGMARRATYRKGELLFRPGSPGDHVYILAHGRIKILALSPAGRSVILWFCFPGEIFGLAEMARGGRREVACEACADSEALVIPQQQFKEFLLRDGEAAMLVVDLLSCRLRGLADMLLNLSSDDVSTRLVKLLIRLGARYGKPASDADLLLDISLTHQEMADMIGTTRQSVSTTLNEFKRQGLLSVENHCIYIRNGKRLEDLLRRSTSLAVPEAGSLSTLRSH
jgi:CRP/FNR family transcriptional regulator